MWVIFRRPQCVPVPGTTKRALQACKTVGIPLSSCRFHNYKVLLIARLLIAFDLLFPQTLLAQENLCRSLLCFLNTLDSYFMIFCVPNVCLLAPPPRASLRFGKKKIKVHRDSNLSKYLLLILFLSGSIILPDGL